MDYYVSFYLSGEGGRRGGNERGHEKAVNATIRCRSKQQGYKANMEYFLLFLLSSVRSYFVTLSLRSSLSSKPFHCFLAEHGQLCLLALLYAGKKTWSMDFINCTIAETITAYR